jgi:hypothetical protein
MRERIARLIGDWNFFLRLHIDGDAWYFSVDFEKNLMGSNVMKNDENFAILHHFLFEYGSYKVLKNFEKSSKVHNICISIIDNLSMICENLMK